jgi:hypothetical protein
MFSGEDDTLAKEQLNLVFRCYLPHRVSLDLAIIQPYRTSSWRPKTLTDCPIREKNARPNFIALRHVTRGVLLSPIFDAPRAVFYVVDCVDEEMFLCVHNIE